jgi:hypothetical protein
MTAPIAVGYELTRNSIPTLRSEYNNLDKDSACVSGREHFHRQKPLPVKQSLVFDLQAVADDLIHGFGRAANQSRPP